MGLMSYTPVAKLSRNLLGTIYHTIPAARYTREMADLIRQQRRQGLDARLLLVTNDQAVPTGQFRVAAEQEVKGIPVIEVSGNLGDPEHPSYQAYEHFGRFFWQTMVKSLELQNSVIHFHNFTMGPTVALAPRVELGNPVSPGVVFTEIWRDWSRDQKEFEAGAMREPLNRVVYNALANTHRESDSSGVARKYLPHFTIHLGLPIGQDNIDGLTRSYLEARYGIGFLFNRSLVEHLRRQGARVIHNLIIVTPEPPSEKERIIEQIMGDEVLGKVINRNGIQVFHLSQFLDPELPDVMAPPQDRELGNASNFFGVLVKIVRNMKGLSDKQRLEKLRDLLKDCSTVILIGGGNSNRLPVKRDKADVPIGENPFGVETLNCLLPLLAQNQTEQVDMVGCDQIFATAGPQMVGGKLFSSAHSKLAMVMCNHHKPDAKTLKMLGDRGIAFADEIDWILEGHEKLKRPGEIEERMDALERSAVLENTMISVLDPEIVLQYLTALMRKPRHEPEGRTLLDTLPFDMVGDLYFSLIKLRRAIATDSSIQAVKDNLVKKLAVKVLTKDGPEDRTIAKEDLDALVGDLQELVADTGGIRVIRVDRFHDVGAFEEECNTLGTMLSASVPDQEETLAARQEREFGYLLRYYSGFRTPLPKTLGGIPINRMEGDEEPLADHINLISNSSTLIGPRVRVAAGTVLNEFTMLAGNTEFFPDEATECESHLLLINARIRGGRVKFTEPIRPNEVPTKWRLVMDVDITQGPDDVLELPRGGAIIGYHVPSAFYTDPAKYKQWGKLPIGINLKDRVEDGKGKPVMDPVWGKYELAGSKEIVRIPNTIPWRDIVNILDQRHRPIIADDAFAEIADPKVLNKILLKAGLIKSVVMPMDEEVEESKAAPEAAVDLGLPGFDLAPAADPMADLGLPGFDFSAEVLAGPPAEVEPPLKLRKGDYYILQDFREKRADFIAALKDPNKNPTGLTLNDGQIERLWELLAAAHATHR